MSSQIAYEQPLNERIRTFLRAEFLFDQSANYQEGNSEWDTRQCLDAMLDLTDLLGRSDVKNELGKELERHASTLSALQRNPGVDQQRLGALLRDINAHLNALRDPAFQPGLAVRKDELVTSLRQRNSIAGGACNFDLPAYHHWLHRPPAHRKRQIELWQQDLLTIRKALKLALHMIRNSTTPTRECATRGFYQKPIESNVACQLVRIVVPAEFRWFPEISGGRHRFTVRFMEQGSTSDRPTQTEEDVEFELHCCIL